MNRWLIVLMLVLLAACASRIAPPPPPPPPPPPSPPAMAEPPVMAVEPAEIMEGSIGPQDAVGSSRPARRSSALRQSTAPARPITALSFTDPQPDLASPAEGPADDGVEQGVAAFVKPPPMEVDHWYVVEFVAGPTEQKIREETEGQQLTGSTQVYVARMMRVTLLDDPAFEIKAKGTPEQMTGLDKTATWLWDVRPKSADGTALQAKVEVLRKNADGSFETIESYTRQVDVTVRVGGMKRAIGAIDDASSLGEKLTKLFGTWQKTIAALVALLGAAGLLAWKLGLKRSKPVD